MMKNVLLIGIVMCSMNVAALAHETYFASGWKQVVVLGEFVPEELDDVPVGVLNAVDNAYENSEIEAVAKEMDESGRVVYQFTLLNSEGLLYNVFFTDRGIELK